MKFRGKIIGEGEASRLLYLFFYCCFPFFNQTLFNNLQNKNLKDFDIN